MRFLHRLHVLTSSWGSKKVLHEFLRLVYTTTHEGISKKGDDLQIYLLAHKLCHHEIFITSYTSVRTLRMQEDETKLSGGNTSSVFRVGETVRRMTGSWSVGVHELLLYLEKQGFQNAPRFLGLDEQGREILTFIEGEVGNYPLAHYMWSDEVLIEVARLIRRYHDATVGFVASVASEEAHWQIEYPDRSKHEVLCHNDLAPYNTVYVDGKPCALIDFDNAGPGPRAWDLAHAAYRFVPLAHLHDPEMARVGVTDIQTQGRRLQLFCDSYGISAQAVLAMVGPRLQTLGNTIVERATEGNKAFQKILVEGYLEHYEREMTDLQYHRTEIEACLVS